MWTRATGREPVTFDRDQFGNVSCGHYGCPLDDDVRVGARVRIGIMFTSILLDQLPVIATGGLQSWTNIMVLRPSR